MIAARTKEYEERFLSPLVAAARALAMLRHKAVDAGKEAR
jgi:hypothetical protein